jgi:protein-S-isoprenylcysteine O-methyltransferase Ste14
MTTTTPARWPWIAPILLYAVSALEMIIMISPAAAYFYSVYTPLFHGLEQSSLTAWLPQFFLPHLAHTAWPAFRWLSIAGAVLTLAGLIGFLACAVQLYWGKFVRKQLVSGGLYGRVRHPQYLCLAVAGAGLLLLWPRFFILATYLLMLGLYYLLARHEEEVVRARYGAPAEAYMATVAMFNPFRRPPAGQAFSPPARARAFAGWLLVVAAGLGLALGLRAVSIGQLHLVRDEDPAVTALALRERSADDIRALTASVLGDDAVRAWRQARGEESLFLQIGSGDGLLGHLLVDLGMRQDAIDALPDAGAADFAVLSRVTGADGAALPGGDPLALTTRIEPLFLARRGADDSLAVRPLPADGFHEDFSRIRF